MSGFYPNTHGAVPTTHHQPQYQPQYHQCPPPHQQYYQPQPQQWAPPVHHHAPIQAPCPCADCVPAMGYGQCPQQAYAQVPPQHGMVPCPVVVPRLNKAGAATPYTHSPYTQNLAPEPMVHQPYALAPQHHGLDHNDSSVSSHPSSIAGHLEDRRHSSGSFSSGDSSSNEDHHQTRKAPVEHIHASPAPESVASHHSNGELETERQGGIVKITVENIHMSIGKVTTIAGSPHGSSFLQAALRQFPIEAFEVIYKEVAPVMAKLLQDKHACYVVKMVLEMMDKEEAIAHLTTIATTNEELLLTLCTKDLHSRRMIQFILDFSGPSNCRYLLDLVMRRPMDIVRTQQGCITLQRILDHFPAVEKETFFATVRGNFMEYALDPFGNYIIQYMLTEGNQVENSNTLALYTRGQLHNMICHKYASNVIEKCFGLVTPELQHDIIEEMFNAPEPALMRVLTDSSANYVVQAAIRAASFRDVTLINNRIGALLPHIQFGKKLQQRLARRLKQ